MDGVPNLLISVCLGIALSACCGFRVFLPMLGASVAAHNGWMELSGDMQWLSQWPALISLSIAAIMEIIAYYIPFLDNLLDFVAAPIAVFAGTLLAASIIPFPEQEPLIRWGFGLLAGGATAGTIQIGTGLIRIFSTKATIGSGNALVASAENTAAFLGTVLGFFIPVFMASILVLLVIWVIVRTVLKIIRHENKVFLKGLINLTFDLAIVNSNFIRKFPN